MDTPVESKGVPRGEALFAAFTAAFCVVLVLTNIVGVKLFQLFPDGRPAWMPGEGGLTLTSGIITYPLTFLITDLVAEIWGRKRAQLMVWLGFGTSVLMLGVVAVARVLPPSPFWSVPELGFSPSEMQRAFDVSFHLPGLLLFASMAAYLIAQLCDVQLYHFWWRVTGGRHMWLRNNGSTSISQLVDTAVVNGIFLPFAFGFGFEQVLEVIVAAYLCKLLMAAVDTPLLYLGRYLLRNALGLEHDSAPQRAPLA